MDLSSLPWLDRAVDALIATWNAAPVEKRWTVGVVVVLSFAAGTWLFPGLAALVKAFKGGGK